MRSTKLLSVLSIGLAVGCGGTPDNPDVPVIATEDAPLPPGCGAPVLSGPDIFGSSEGTYFPDVTIPQCDGTPYSFYNDEYCAESHRFTVVSIAALWCVPCQEESRQLAARISAPYADRGVRLLQVIVDGTPPGSSFTPAQCQQWVTTYGLVNTELMDPGSLIVGSSFPSGSLPSTLIVDENGLIRYREDGATPNLVTLTTALDSLLAE
jgi:hypothetical protein